MLPEVWSTTKDDEYNIVDEIHTLKVSLVFLVSNMSVSNHLLYAFVGFVYKEIETFAKA